MTDLNRLSTSLTKHGAHKIANIIDSYPAEDTLQHLSGSIRGVNIELAQAKKNLSAYTGEVPALWNTAKSLGNPHVRALTLIGIIFSHNKLITAFREGSTSPFKGAINRGNTLGGKAFTNTANNVEELGFITSHTTTKFEYDLSPIFDLPGLAPLAAELLSHKLKHAHWDEQNSLAEELLRIGANDVFGVTQSVFRDWLSDSAVKDNESNGQLTFDDIDFFEENITTVDGNYSFTAGHTPKQEGSVEVSAPKGRIEATLLHNQIQNELYSHLCEVFGDECVGTEQPAGSGTKIDVVVSTDEETVFYEIKTARSAKACIRQALPQLLEYAYWPDKENANRLVIVSQNRLDRKSEKYLTLMREKFSIPVYYQRFNLKKKVLE